MTRDANETGSLRAVGRSALILTSSTIAVQVVAIARELFVASQIGVSSRLDALLIALVLPTTLSGLITSGMVTALVPAYLSARSRGPDEARRLSGAVIAWVALVGLMLSALLWLGSGLAIAVSGPGLATVDRDSAIAYLQLLAPLALVTSVSAVLLGVCQAEQRFRSMAIATMVGPIVTFGIVVAAWDALDLAALAVGSLIGPVVTLMILAAAMVEATMLPRLSLRPQGIDVRALLAHAGPLTLGAAILQVNVVVDRAIATLLAPGAVSALRYGEVLIRTPISAISPAWSATIYPTLVHMALDPAGERLATVTSRMVRFAIVGFIPITILTIAVAPVAVTVAYGRGAFTDADLALTTGVAAGFAPLIVVLMTSPVMRLALNARRLGRIILFGAVLNVLLNAVFDVLFGIALGVVGVALSSGLTAAAVAVFFAQRLARSDPGFHLRPIARSLAASVVASLPGALLVGAFAWSGTYPSETLPALAVLAAFGVVGMLSFVAIGWLTRIEEVRQLVQVGTRRLPRADRGVGPP